MTNWTQADSIKLAHLLSTSPLISTLEDKLPELGGNGLEEAAMASCERKGAEGIVQEIINLATVVEKAQEKSPYIEGLDKFEQPAPPKE